jgi:hypothetical protein
VLARTSLGSSVGDAFEAGLWIQLSLKHKFCSQNRQNGQKKANKSCAQTFCLKMPKNNNMIFSPPSDVKIPIEKIAGAIY